MKKSEIYKQAQIAVVRCVLIPDVVKLAIIKELQDKEGLELWKEKEAEKNETN